jgi:hypothetical protein
MLTRDASTPEPSLEFGDPRSRLRDGEGSRDRARISGTGDAGAGRGDIDADEQVIVAGR